MKTKNKIIAGIATLGILILTGIIALVSVLASQNSTASFEMNVIFHAEGIFGQAYASYTIGDVTKYMTTIEGAEPTNELNNANNCVEFDGNNSDKNLYLPAEIILIPSEPYVIFTYHFENESSNPYYVKYSYSDDNRDDSNVTVQYSVNSDSNWSSDTPDFEVPGSAFGANGTGYCSIKVENNDRNKEIKFNGEMKWELSRVR